MLKVSKFFSTCFLIAALSIGAKAQSLIYYNNFNTGQAVWKDFDDALSHAKIENGKYVLTHKQHTSSIMLNAAAIDYTRDFAVETTVTYVTGEAYPVGLVFGAANSLNMYYFCITQTGQFVLASFQQGANKIIINWTPSNAILKGAAPNKLRVEKSENVFKYFINDALVATGPVLQPFGASIGLMVSGLQTAAFDYIKATYLEPQTPAFSATQLVSTGITETAYHTDFNSDDQNGWILPPQAGIVTSIANGFF